MIFNELVFKELETITLYCESPFGDVSLNAGENIFKVWKEF
jgi:hypothetical protein